ncbi:hypothetical protein Tco_0750962, partial [Tanacetum coccineum]
GQRVVMGVLVLGVIRCQNVMAMEGGSGLGGMVNVKGFWNGPKFSQVLRVFREQGLIFAGILGLSAFFSMAETLITTLSPWKIHKRAASLQSKPLPYSDLYEIVFQSISANGDGQWTNTKIGASASVSAASASGPSASGASTSGASAIRERVGALNMDDDPLVDVAVHVDDDDDDDDGNSRAHKINDEVRPKKKAKTSRVTMDDLMVDMQSALRHIVGTTDGPTTEQCYEKLKLVGLQSTDPVFLATFNIFGQSRQIREAWMTFPSEPDVLKGWIELTGLIMDYNQKLALIIVMFNYLRYVRSRKGKRKRDNNSAMSGRQFTLELLQGNDRQCVELLRMSRDSFISLCTHFRVKEWLKDSKHVSVEEKMAMFFMMLDDELFSTYDQLNVQLDNEHVLVEDDGGVEEDQVVQPQGNASDREYMTNLRDQIAQQLMQSG